MILHDYQLKTDTPEAMQAVLDSIVAGHLQEGEINMLSATGGVTQFGASFDSPSLCVACDVISGIIETPAVVDPETLEVTTPAVMVPGCHVNLLSNQPLSIADELIVGAYTFDTSTRVRETVKAGPNTPARQFGL